METTFGKDNPQINVVLGGAGLLQTVGVPREADSVLALSAFLETRRRPRDPAPGAPTSSFRPAPVTHPAEDHSARAGRMIDLE